MNPERKILFTDLDGTLLNDSKKVTDKNRHAVRKALDMGHSIVLTTGRPISGVNPIIKDLKLDQEGCYAIAYNGGLIFDCYHEKTIYSKPIPLPYVHFVFEQARKYGLHCQTYSHTHVLSEQNTPELEDYACNTTVPCIVDSALLKNLKDEPIKILVIDLHSREKLNAYRSAIHHWSRGKISTFFSSEFYLEHVCEGISKGSAVEYLCSHLKIQLHNAIAAGDAENDIPMLKIAKSSAAMRNATAEVKKNADYITQNDNNHDGIAEVIQKFML